jgi:hypothetical protein
MGDGRQSKLPINDKQNYRSTTIGQACSGSLERRRIGHRQAGSEVVCVDTDACLHGHARRVDFYRANGELVGTFDPSPGGKGIQLFTH